MRKRKRCKGDAEGGEDGNNVTEGEEDTSKQGGSESVRACCPEVPTARKRTRRIARDAVHTAAAVVVGAVATWSALAFV